MYQVYKIVNLTNNKIYIGYTIRPLSVRLKAHFLKAKQGSVSSLHKAIRKYGEHQFTIELVQEYSCKNEMIEGEIQYIKMFDTYRTDYGYNDTPGGDGGNTNGGKKFPDEWRLKLFTSQAGKPRKFSRKFSEEIERQICKLYLEGKSIYSLSKQFDCFKSVVISILGRNNIERRKTIYSDHKNGQNIFSLEQELEICKLYQTKNFSRMDLAKKFNCGKTTIRDILLRHKINL